MKTSKKGIDLISKWEGFRENAYLDVANVPTIGYGTINYNYGTGLPNKPVKMGDKITKEKALELLKKQIDAHAKTIETYVKTPLNQNQFDALSSFQYNLGAHILKNSALLKHINNGDFAKAGAEMLLYNKARVNGVLQEVKGLTNRRREEVALFLTPVVSQEKCVVKLETGVFGNKEDAQKFVKYCESYGIFFRNLKIEKQ